MPAQALFDDVPASRQASYIVTLLQHPSVAIPPLSQMSELSNDLSTLSMNESTHSPAQSLPPEITIEIVLELSETQWDVAWTAASVCRSWRFAALNVTGCLWSRIYIPSGTIPHSLARRTLPNKRIETWLHRGGPTTSLYLDIRDNSPLICNALSDALHTTGAMSRLVEMRLSVISREQWRMRTPAPNLRVLWLTGPADKRDSLVLLSAALQGLFGYASFQRPSTSLKELHLQKLKIDASSHVFLQYITHLFLFNCVEANHGVTRRLLSGCSTNLQALSMKGCTFSIDSILRGAQLPRLHTLATSPNESVWIDATVSWASQLSAPSMQSQLSAPSLQNLNTSAPHLKTVSPGIFQFLKHLTVSLRVMGTGLEREIKELVRWFNTPGLLTVTLVLKHTVNDISSTAALATPHLSFGHTVERVTIRLPPGVAATARMECERLNRSWAEVGKALVIEPWAED